MEIRTTYTVKCNGEDKTFPTKTEAEADLAKEELINSAAVHLEELFKNKRNLQERGLTFWSADALARFIEKNNSLLIGICEFFIDDYDKRRLAHNYAEYLEEEE